MKVIQRFWYVQNVGLIFLKIHQKQPKLQLWYNSSMLEKPRHFTLIKILRYNFPQLCLTLMSTFSAVDIIISNEEEIFGSKTLMMVTTIFFII